jgi:hydroxymethylglutaryl-CoA lyase/3-methylcrotonyl-CoA carboxylase alpha subunit
MDVETGVSLDRLLEAGAFACRELKRAPASRVAQAYAARCGNPTEAPSRR